MTDKANIHQYIECRLVIIEPHSMRTLMTGDAGSQLLPRASIRSHARVAEALTEAIEQRYDLRTIQLALLPQAEDLSYCAVHEIISTPESVPASLLFMGVDGIAPSELSATEVALVLRIMKGEAKELGRFARLGWIDELIARIGGYRDRRVMPVIRQLNQGIDFCLLNLRGSDSCNLWFKAVGEPNTHEYLLTQELTRQFPDYLPRPLAWIPEWNGWITKDVSGAPLNQSSDSTAWEQALTALAVMQRNTIESKASLYKAGAKEWTCARLRSLSKPFFEEAERAIQSQTSTRARTLNSEDVQRLRVNIEAALSALAHSGIPETLLHGDIGHGNIVISPGGPVFLDWAETYIGHPFLSAEYLLADFERSRHATPRETKSLRRSYAMHWQDYASPDSLADVTVLAPAVAAFAYAVIAWDVNRRRPDPTCVWPLLRSMLRRTERELESRSEVSV